MSCNDCLRVAEFFERFQKQNEGKLSWEEFLYKALSLAHQIERQCENISRTNLVIDSCPESGNLLVQIQLIIEEHYKEHRIDIWQEVYDDFGEECRQISLHSPPSVEFSIDA